MSPLPCDGQVALVAGATRGAGRAIAIELARAGAHVYATGRSSARHGPSELGRPETIEETAALIEDLGGSCQAVRVDHTEPAEVRRLVELIRSQHSRLDILVNDMFGGDRYAEWGIPMWRHDLDGGLRMLRTGVESHVITAACALELMLAGSSGLLIEVTDGTAEVNREIRPGPSFYYDLVKGTIQRIIQSLTAELAGEPVTVVGVTPGWLRSERMLEQFGVSERNWRDALAETPSFEISESPAYVARGIAALAADPHKSRFGGAVLSARQLADAYCVTDTDGSRPDCWGLVAAYGFDHGRPDDLEHFR